MGKGTIKVGAVNCDKEKSFCQRKGINANDTPSFAFVNIDGTLDFYSSSASNKSPNAKKLHEFSMSKLPYHLIQNVNNIAHIQQRLLQGTKNNKPAILLLTDKYDTSALYVSLAYEFRDKFTFGESRAKNLALSKEFSVKKYPLLLALFPNKGVITANNNNNGVSKPEVVKYDGPIKGEKISKWINNIYVERKKMKKKKNASSANRSRR